MPLEPESTAYVAHPTLGAVGEARISRALAGPGLWLDVGVAKVRLRSRAPALARQLAAVYRHFPLRDSGDWADIHIGIHPPAGLRRWWRPQVVFDCDGVQPFDPFPASAPLPLFEWGANWHIGRRCNHMLMLHAGALEREGHALLMPALPGSGKSTLTAALSLRGWRLLSDEFGAVNPATLQIHPVLKPVALKNESIQVIRRLEPQAPLGPEFPETRKGTVAHLAAGAAAVAAVHRPAWPGAIVMPRWKAGSPTRLEPVEQRLAFSALAFNAFNYNVLAGAGFRAAVALVRLCPAWQLTYSDLGDAIRTLDHLWPEVVAGAAGRRTAARAAAAEDEHMQGSLP